MASSERVQAKIASLGMSLLQPSVGLAALERLLAAPALPRGAVLLPPQLSSAAHSASVDVVPFKWGRMLQRYQLPAPLFQAMAQGEFSGRDAAVSRSSALSQQTTQPAARVTTAPAQAQLLPAVRSAVQDVLGREVSLIAVSRRLFSAWCVVESMVLSVGLPKERVLHHHQIFVVRQKSVCALAAGVP